MIDADDHRHGSRRGYEVGCRNTCCTNARRRAYSEPPVDDLELKGGDWTYDRRRGVEVYVMRRAAS